MIKYDTCMLQLIIQSRSLQNSPIILIQSQSTIRKPGMNNKEGKPLTKKEKKRAKMSQKGERTGDKEVKEVNQEGQEEGQDIDYNKLDGQEHQNIEVGFLVGEIREEYYHSLKTILLRMAEITKLTNSEIADAVVSNSQIGNVVLADDYSEDEQENEQEEEDSKGKQGNQQEDDELNVYSVLTVIPGNKKISKQLKKYVAKVSSKKVSEQIIQDINNVSTSVLINERLSNLPAFVVNSSHEVFKGDMVELKKNNKGLYKELFSGYMLNVSEIQFQGSEDLDKLIFSKFEDYEMCKRAKAWWLGERNKSFKKRTDMRNLFYLIDSSQYFEGVTQIKTYLQE